MQYLNEVKRSIVNDRGSPSVAAAVTSWIVCVIPIPKLSAYDQCALSQLKNMAGGVREGRDGYKGVSGGNRKRRCVLGTLKSMTLQVHYVLASHRAGPHGMLGPSTGVWDGSYYGFNLDCVVKTHVFTSPALLGGGDAFKK